MEKKQLQIPRQTLEYHASQLSKAEGRTVTPEELFLYIGNEGILMYGSNMEFFIRDANEEISADDILSIEIVEGTPEFNYDKAVELAKPLMHYLSETGHTEVISVCKEGISAIPMGTFLYKG